MPTAELLELAQAGRIEEFESRCLELLSSGQLTLAQLVGPFEQLERAGQAERLATLTQMVFEHVGAVPDPAAALPLVRIALTAAPQSAELRALAVRLYTEAYGTVPGFAALLEASGLKGGRPVRAAMKMLDLCLTLQPGDALYCRSEDRAAEVVDVDRANGLFTLRREGRVTTLPGPEVARDYERIAPDDFRLLRQLRPEKVAAMLRENPVEVVLGIVRSHGGRIDADELKHELSPRLIPAADWAGWWTKTRTALKRCPHIRLEGRSPLILTYLEAAQTLEDETWAALGAKNDLGHWIATIEGYFREKQARREAPDAALLARFREHIWAYVAAVRARRPAEALAGALALERLGAKGVPGAADARALADELLRTAAEPRLLLAGIELDALLEPAFEALRRARPADWLTHAIAWLEDAPAALLDRLVQAAIEAGRVDAVQSFIDKGLSDLPRHPELMYWLWKGPRATAGLRLPSEAELFRLIIDTLSSLGRTLVAEPQVVKEFRQRAKAALALRDYEKAGRCLAALSEAAAITVKHELQRLEGLGENTPARLLDLLRAAHPELWVVARREVRPWEDPETVWCTAEGLARRTAERDQIVNVQMRDNARRIGEAAAHGDLSENSEYKFALEERDLLRARLAKINEELSRARVLEPHDVPTDHVGIGTRVTLRRGDTGAEITMTFLGPFETDIERGVYSYLAPLSQRLMGAPVGARVTLSLEGRDVEVEVVAVASAL